MLSRQEMERAFETNGDGAGMAWSDGERLCVRKPFWTAKTCWEAYCEAQAARRRGPLVIHFRLGTCGAEIEENTHPFICGVGRVAVFHNGVLEVERSTEAQSDTAAWVATVLWGRPAGQIMSRRFRRHFERHIGGGKMVFLHSSGRVAILGRERGVEAGGNWYSGRAAWDSPKVVKVLTYGAHDVDFDRDEKYDCPWWRGLTSRYRNGKK